jgi:AcrR family transcriptional regulator
VSTTGGETRADRPRRFIVAPGRTSPPSPPAVSAVGGVDTGNPRTADRRARTRQKLLDAARVVFERDGFHDARLADIVQEAEVATGTFYNYYRSKELIFRDLMTGVIADLFEQSNDELPRDDPVAGIHAANRAYVKGYLRNARLMTILVEIGSQSEVQDLRIEIRGGFEERISRAIRRWQQAGIAYRDLDPVYTANALSYMVDRFLYEWTVLELDYDEDKVVETVSRLWVRSLGLERPALAPPSPAKAKTAGATRPKKGTATR